MGLAPRNPRSNHVAKTAAMLTWNRVFLSQYIQRPKPVVRVAPQLFQYHWYRLWPDRNDFLIGWAHCPVHWIRRKGVSLVPPFRHQPSEFCPERRSAVVDNRCDGRGCRIARGIIAVICSGFVRRRSPVAFGHANLSPDRCDSFPPTEYHTSFGLAGETRLRGNLQPRQTSINIRAGSSTTSLIRRRKVTASRPSTNRWS